jgi:hypothetical protein
MGWIDFNLAAQPSDPQVNCAIEWLHFTMRSYFE